MKNELITHSLLLVLAAFTAFLLIPLFMIGTNPGDYSFIDTAVFFKTAILHSLIFALVLNLVHFAIYKTGHSKIGSGFTFFVLAWIVFAGFVLPVSKSTGMIEPEVNPVHFFNLILVFLLSVGAAVAAGTVIKKYIQMFLILVILISTVPSLLSIYNSDSLSLAKHDKKIHPSLQVSAKKNIFIISFDGMPGKIAADIVKTHSSSSKILKDFIVFNNAVSQDPATNGSLIGDIFGVQDYKSIGKSINAVKNKLSAQGLMDNAVHKKIDDSYHYSYSGYGMRKIQLKSQAAQKGLEDGTREFFKYPVVRVWTSVMLTIANRTAGMFSSPQQKKLTTLAERLSRHNGAGWDKKNILELKLYESFVSGMTVSDKKYSIRYLHFKFTHFPVDFDAQGRYRSDDKKWYDASQNEQGVRNECTGAIKTFAAFLEKLKELKIYDKSLIVFKSDHGKPAGYFSQAPDNATINNHQMWGYNRHRPMLMIKDFNASQKKPVFKNQLVLLNDIAKTVCEKSGVHQRCAIFNGVNLLGKNLNTDEPYYLYVVKDAESSFRFSTHLSVKIPSRKISLQKAMEDSPLINLTVPQK